MDTPTKAELAAAFNQSEYVRQFNPPGFKLKPEDIGDVELHETKPLANVEFNVESSGRDCGGDWYHVALDEAGKPLPETFELLPF